MKCDTKALVSGALKFPSAHDSQQRSVERIISDPVLRASVIPCISGRSRPKWGNDPSLHGESHAMVIISDFIFLINYFLINYFSLSVF